MTENINNILRDTSLYNLSHHARTRAETEHNQTLPYKTRGYINGPTQHPILYA
jgi:hypothetical protein